MCKLLEHNKGHTRGHTSLFSATSGVLFCGDSMVVDKDGALLPARSNLSWNDARTKEAVKRNAALGARIVCSGHGPVVMDAVGKFPGLLQRL